MSRESIFENLKKDTSLNPFSALLSIIPGSYFLSIPIKRNDEPYDMAGSNPFSKSVRSKPKQQYYLDFKTSLLPIIVKHHHGFNLKVFDDNSTKNPTPSPMPEEGRERKRTRSLQESLMLRYDDSLLTSPFQEPLLPSESQWQMLNHLRIHAGCPERSEKGIDRLLNYYSQLVFLESKFPFEIEKINVEFCWFESFQPRKKVSSTCFQYEKACVLFNLAALYSQMGSMQQVVDGEGFKLAANYYQKAAGVLLYIRDSLCVRFKFQPNRRSDLYEMTLTVLTDLMLAQAAECYLDKANLDKASSPVTSQVAIQAADYYNSCLKKAKIDVPFAQSRLSKEWINQIKIKSYVIEAVANLHMPPSSPKSISERLARLEYALGMIQKAEKLSNDVNLHNFANYIHERSVFIKQSYEELQAANAERFHQPIMSQKLLPAVKRPNTTLVSPTPFLDVYDMGYQDLLDGVKSKKMQDLIDRYVNRVQEVSEQQLKGLLQTSVDLDEKIAGIESKLPRISHQKLNPDSEQAKVVEQIKAYQNEERIVGSDDMLNSLNQLRVSIGSQLSKCVSILDNVDISDFSTDPSIFQQIGQIRAQVGQESENLKELDMKALEMAKLYEEQVVNFDALRWNEDNLKQWAQSLDFEESMFDLEEMKEQRELFLNRLADIKDEIQSHILEIDEIGKDGSRTLNYDLLNIKLSNLNTLSETIRKLNLEKEALLERVKALTECLVNIQKQDDFRRAQIEQFTKFTNNFHHYIYYRESIQVLLQFAVETNSNANSLLQSCEKFPIKVEKPSQVFHKEIEVFDKVEAPPATKPDHNAKHAQFSTIVRSDNPIRATAFTAGIITQPPKTIPTAPSMITSVDSFHMPQRGKSEEIKQLIIKALNINDSSFPAQKTGTIRSQEPQESYNEVLNQIRSVALKLWTIAGKDELTIEEHRTIYSLASEILVLLSHSPSKKAALKKIVRREDQAQGQQEENPFTKSLNNIKSNNQRIKAGSEFLSEIAKLPISPTPSVARSSEHKNPSFRRSNIDFRESTTKQELHRKSTRSLQEGFQINNSKVPDFPDDLEIIEETDQSNEFTPHTKQILKKGLFNFFQRRKSAALDEPDQKSTSTKPADVLIQQSPLIKSVAEANLQSDAGRIQSIVFNMETQKVQQRLGKKALEKQFEDMKRERSKLVNEHKEMEQFEPKNNSESRNQVEEKDRFRSSQEKRGTTRLSEYLDGANSNRGADESNNKHNESEIKHNGSEIKHKGSESKHNALDIGFQASDNEKSELNTEPDEGKKKRGSPKFRLSKQKKGGLYFKPSKVMSQPFIP